MGCVVASVLGVSGGNNEWTLKRSVPAATSGTSTIIEPVHVQLRDASAEDSRKKRTINVPGPVPLVAPTPMPSVPKPEKPVQDTAIRALGEAPVGSRGSDTGWRDEDVEDLIRSYDWDDEEALAVARCESGDDLYAAPEENLNHRGPFQASYVHAWRYAARGWDWSTATPDNTLRLLMSCGASKVGRRGDFQHHATGFTK